MPYVVGISRGMSTIVDDEDVGLTDVPWVAIPGRRTWYVGRRNNVRLHRLVLERKLGRLLDVGEFTDHIDGNGLNNLRDNLRSASYSENARNANKGSNRTGYKGVRKQHKRWVAQITVDRHVMHIGTYDTPEEAHEAYKEAAIKYHGEFARFE